MNNDTEHFSSDSCKFSLPDMIKADSLMTFEASSKMYFYKSPSPGRLPIAIDVGLGSDVGYGNMAGCFFNVFIRRIPKYVFNHEEFHPFAALIPYDIKMIINGWEYCLFDVEPYPKDTEEDIARKKVHAFINHYKDDYCFGGLIFKYSLDYNDFPESSKLYDRIISSIDQPLIYMTIPTDLEKTSMGICQYNPSSSTNEKASTNAEPTDTTYYGDGFSPDEYSLYRGYLTKLQETFRPPLYVYDFKPISVSNGEVKFNKFKFYQLLDLFAKRYLATERPFWLKMQSDYLSLAPNEEWKTQEAYERLFRFQMISALGYGCQGFVYDKLIGEDGLFDSSKNLKESGKAAKAVNQEMRDLNFIFLDCQIFDNCHTGGSYIPFVKSMSSGSFGPLTSITPGSSGVYIAWIKKFNFDYLLVVNQDYNNPQTVSLTFDTDLRVKELTPRQVMANNSGSTNRLTISRDIPAGGYLIFQWD